MMSPLLPVLAAIQEAEHGASAGPFAVNPGLIIWTWIVFIALFLVLRRYAWPQILKATEQREQKIADQLSQAEKMNTEARTLLEEQKKLTAEARNAAQTMLAEAKAVMEKERAAAIEKTKAEQEALLERARREIVAEQEKAIAELRREAIDLALGAAGRVIGQRLDADQDRKIVMDYLSKVETTH
ncbi:MAG: F0F1 ATP synthase subunit B [Gemmatimonadota bacterium]